MKQTLRLLAVALPIALAACGDDEPPPVAPASFAPLTYSYLTKLRINTGTIDVQDHSVSPGSPGSENNIANLSPVPPAQALAQMARDRLIPAGLSGQADFVIDDASIIREPNGALDGHMVVHLDINGANGAHAFAQAQVSQQHVPGGEPENQQVVLYDMTRKMMDAMNVELEFQIRHSIPNWLVPDNVVPTKVEITPLSPAAPDSVHTTLPQIGAPPVAPGAPGGVDMVPATGDEVPPPPPPQMSPPPGYLQLPPETVPQQ